MSEQTRFPGLADLPTEKLAALLEERSGERLASPAYGGLAGIAKALGVNLATGYCQHDAAAMRELYGANVLPERPPPSLPRLLWEAYSDRTLILLSCAAGISLAVGIWEQLQTGEQGWIEGVAIVLAIVLVVLVNALNDWQRERQFRLLSARVKDRRITVVRGGGQAQRISIFELVVGDTVLFEPGEVLPADGLLIAGQKVTIDESGMTGESEAVAKREPPGDPFLLSGTRVIDGTGRMLVLAVGPQSSQGRMVMAMQGDEPGATPLQIKLDRLAGQIAKGGVAVAVLLAVALSTRYVIVRATHPPWPPAPIVVQHFTRILIQAVTIVVVAVPEGLPMAVTIALAYATTRMLADRNLVRVLSACETMGGATSICSDKTGTLTENRMTVVRYSRGLRVCDRSEGLGEGKGKGLGRLLADGIAVNSTAFESGGEWIGTRTEVALLCFAADCLGLPGHYYEEARARAKILQRIPFSSERKRMVTAVEEYGADGRRPVGRVYLKGASEIVLARCSSYHEDDGLVEIDGEGRESLRGVISKMAGQSLRTIGLAYRDIVDPDEFAAMIESEEGLEGLLSETKPNARGFRLLCIVGIEDPLRPGVPEAVAKCQRAGIFVRMVTGDNVETARAIAEKAGILQRGGVVLEGVRFRTMAEADLAAVLPRLQVLARSSPLDKRILVRKLRELGEIVAVTGDGTNDGPALKAAHVGFSMGIAGTEVAKEASSIVLLDDNFASIVRAVAWGRAVNDSVRRFLQFQLTINVTAVVVASVTAMLDPQDRAGLTAVQLLWVNLIMDSFAALALATEPPDEQRILSRPPESPDGGLLTGQMRRMIVGQAGFHIAVLLALQFLAPRYVAGGAVRRTLLFNTFIFLQLFNEINCRVLDRSLNVFSGITKNMLFVGIWAGTVAVQVLLVQFGGVVFSTVPLDWHLWLFSVGVGLSSLPIGMLIRLLPDFSPAGRSPSPPLHPSRGQLRWQAAIRDAQRNMAFFGAIRRAKRRTPSIGSQSSAAAGLSHGPDNQGR